jgi:hypothetical protein
LNSNRLKVVGRYFIFRDFVPWIGRFELPDRERDLVRGLWVAPSLGALRQAWPTLSPGGTGALLVLASGTLMFLLFLGYLAVLATRAPLPVRASLLLAFCAPISWHFIAKGHSFLHPHMNYVLWYLPFIPYGMIFAVQAGRLSTQTGVTPARSISPAEAA